MGTFFERNGVAIWGIFGINWSKNDIDIVIVIVIVIVFVKELLGNF